MLAAAVEPEQKTVQYMVEQVAVPAYVNWQKTSQDFHSTSEQFCLGKAGLAAVRNEWLNAHHAWLGLQPVLVPPSPADHLGLQVQFWPDKRNLAAKQTEELLKKKEVLSAETLAAGSVVLRSLSASEYILFDSGHDLDDAGQRARFCPLLQANSRHQAMLSERILRVWQQDFASQLLRVPNERYQDARGPLAEFLRAQVTALDVMKKKLGVAIGQPGNGEPQLYQAEAWRAGDTLISLQFAIVGSRKLWNGDGLRALVLTENPALVKDIDEAYQQLQVQLAELQQPLPALLARENGKIALKKLYEQLHELHMLQEKDVAKVLGVQLGFNGTDGD
jgi:predicted lipoprotein